MNAVEMQRGSCEEGSFGANGGRPEIRALTESETRSSQYRDVLTISEVAANLRCSKAHVYNAINGRVTGVSALPAIAMGRRKLVRQSTLEAWKQANERGLGGGMLPKLLEVCAVDASRRTT
jgi:excisionase family DNA binding protein